MRIAIAYNNVGDMDAPDQKDVLVQVNSIRDALIHLGHEVMTLACDLDLSSAKHWLSKVEPEIVFNLVEDLEGHGRLIHLFPFLLDAMAMPYTGSCAEALMMSSNKIMAKERMLAAAIATPEWVGPYPLAFSCFGNSKSEKITAGTWIIKSVWDHASVGLDENSLIHVDHPESLYLAIKERPNQCGRTYFAERFIHGREFNLSLLWGTKGVEVLPPAEIIFEGYENHKPCILGYRAKWDETSFEYHHTPRIFSFGNEDSILISELKMLALNCWNVFGLNGYARVDFRVDPQGFPWILEINANPCLSADAGFAAAAANAGIGYTELIGRIIKETSCRFWPSNHMKLTQWNICHASNQAHLR